MDSCANRFSVASTSVVLNSTLDPAFVAAQLRAIWGLRAACTLHYRGTHDTYRAAHAHGTHFVRVYRAGLRSPADILFEIEVLCAAAAAGAKVARPLVRPNGRWLASIRAPEGERVMALFDAAPGAVVGAEAATAVHVQAYGEAIAMLHTALAGFHGTTTRPLGVEVLLHRPMRWLAPFLEHRADDRAWLEACITRIHMTLEGPLGRACPVGVCHGDLHGGNAHWAADGTVTLFDFDECGTGWLMYDLAAFHWMAERAGRLAVWWPLLCQGYERIRPFTEPEREALPWFVLARHLWQLGYDAWDNRFGGAARADADITAVLESLRSHAGSLIS